MRNRTWAAVVIRPKVTWFSAAGASAEFHATPDWAHIDVARVVLAGQSVWFPPAGDGTVLWQCAENVDTTALVATLRARGCSVSDSGHETGWFTVRKAGVSTVHLGIGHLIQQARTSVTGLDADARLVAMRLARYGDVTGAAWRGTAGLSGCAGLRTIHEEKVRGGQPLWRWDKADALDAVGCSFEMRGSKHKRAFNSFELGSPHVYQFDVNACYLAAANTAMVGWSALVESGPREFDPGHAGYWHVLRDSLGAVPAELVRPGSTPHVWLTTPVMTYLTEIGRRPEVYDSWTAERTGRYLRPWAERLTAALGALQVGDPVDDAVRNAVKDTYARTPGMMARSGGRIYRPDWRDEIVDRARVNILRKVAGSGFSPVRMNVDSVWIAADLNEHEVGRALGVPYRDGHPVWQIGKFRHVKTMTVAEYLETYEKGRVPA
jgi:hypothetical protein